ncbi:hypothetical protein C1I97_25190 [Streptomyces sp. NTH33]|uniref:helix-turn-helix domain-containing protein n=1 Tax=Streptomyces sp. NTH33 TaxID=1735453 RepID=UPI000DA95306|nr:helix-turn-helix domain-containing protein [Streptomyces sp. NTH33]PZG97833.1 hypothetical protein C1I97_25190 [Streptomyces sp. NTH33]
MSTLPRLLYSAQEVATALGVSAYWLQQEARAGRIPATKAAGRWGWSRSQIDEVMDALAVTPSHTTPAPATTTTRPRRTRQAPAHPPVQQLVAKPPRRRR